MKRAIISTDSNIDYLALVPITCFSWAKLGYQPEVWVVTKPENVEKYNTIEKYCFGANFLSIASMEESGIKDSTLSQVMRLFTYPTWNDTDTIVTGDADMLICKDIFTHDSLTSYGFDLTGRSELPICYVKGTAKEWKELMRIDFNNNLRENLGEVYNKAKSDKWEDYWSVDQQLLTARAKEYGFHRINFVDRGFSGPIAANRWDRYSWHIVPNDIIDVHVIRSPLQNWDKIKAMCLHLWPEDNWEWLDEYYNELIKLQ